MPKAVIPIPRKPWVFTFSPNKKKASIAVAGGTRYKSDDTLAALPVLSSHKSSRIAPTDKIRMSQTKDMVNRKFQVIEVS